MAGDATEAGNCYPPALLLFPLPDAQGPLAPLLGRELGRAVLAGGGEAELERVAVQLVDAQVGFRLSRALGHGVVDRFRLLCRVDGELGLEIDLPADGDGGHPVLR